MKHKLMMTVAAAALLAGAGLASAQGTKSEKPDMPGAGSMEQKGSGEHKGGATEQRGQSTQPQQGTQRPAQGAQREQNQPAAGANGREKGPQGAQREPQGSERDKQQGAQRPSTQQDQQGAQREQRPGAQPGQSGAPSTAQGQSGSASASVTLNAEQKTKIRQAIIQRSDAPRVSNVNFSLSVGTVVPRERVKLVAVPPPLVEINPAWRGYLYFLVGDEIVIVEPSSHRIVAVIPV
jgi:hypothetical protein